MGQIPSTLSEKGLREVPESPKHEECPVLGPWSLSSGLGILALGVGSCLALQFGLGVVWEVEKEPKS